MWYNINTTLATNTYYYDAYYYNVHMQFNTEHITNVA